MSYKNIFPSVSVCIWVLYQILGFVSNGGVHITKKISICNSFDLSFPEKSKNLDDCDHLAEGRGAALFLKLVGNSSLPQFQLLHSCQLLDLPTH